VFIAEPPMREALRQICSREDKTGRKIATEIDRIRVEFASTAAIRVYLLQYFWGAATEEGHRFAGHGSSLEDATAVTQSFVATAKRLPGSQQMLTEALGPFAREERQRPADTA
jgi:hypothetical protein